jgi:MscS family membrane protein
MATNPSQSQLQLNPAIDLNSIRTQLEKPKIETWLKEILPDWSFEQFFILDNWQWIGLFAAVVLGFAVRSLVATGFGFLTYFTKKTKNQWDDRIVKVIAKPFGTIVATVFWYSAVHLIGIDGVALNAIKILLQIVASLSLIIISARVADVALDFLEIWARKTGSNMDDQIIVLLRKISKILVWVFGALIAIQNLGLNVMSLVAGLGLGGLAFALAAKDTAANLFGSIMIFIDRPFRVGDWIITNGAEGKVEEIGFRSTRLRTFNDSLVSIPNSVLSTENINNLGLRRHRRLKSVFCITYDTPPEKIEAFMEGVKQIILANPVTDKKDFHVAFNEFGESSLDIVLYCFLKVGNFEDELVEKSRILMEVLRLSAALEVSFAFPTQTLHLESDPTNPAKVRTVFPKEKLRNLGQSFGPKGDQSLPRGLGVFTPPSATVFREE